MNSNKVIIDCDPGVDDALAILLAAASPELDILGITTVAGNAPAATCAENVLKVLELCGHTEIPVYAGMNQPLHRKLMFDGKYSGDDGFNETNLPFPTTSIQEQSAPDFIIECARTFDNIQIISTAPMTNLGSALKKAPDIRHKISRIITTSGNYGLDDIRTPPRCGWNIVVDPEAAKIVMESGIQIRALGLEITSQLDNDMVTVIEQNAPASMIMQFFNKSAAFNRQRGLEPFSLLVDAIAVSYTINPQLADFTQGKVDLRCDEQLDQHFTKLLDISSTANHSDVYAAHTFSFHEYIKMLLNRVFL
ncbi:nucleoside hydrolase [Paenibacillus sp. L3-i20]|uniref:nucleoside hydrolase n=1 Tax=Paenibacillus sp. L3-i20 TaxID=2905833 RepID=UPI001EDD0051|nr:nucleoside hydrolase [Paenibacillus sp. L3-i20]GKU78052.1 hypothetical protein L3i20_v224490 [Paenibacillus sp. L3-i20]